MNIVRKYAGFFVLCLFVINCSLSRADNFTTHIDLKWQAPYNTVLIDYTTKITVLNFTGNHYNFATTKLPFYYNQFKLNTTGSCNVDEAVVENASYAVLDKAEQAIFDNSIRQSVQKTYNNIKVNIVTIKKEAYASVALFPFRKNEASGQIEKLVSFDLKLTYTANNSINRNTSLHANTYNSVLSTGKWRKISVTEEGVYKLSYAFIKNAGIDVKNLDPKNIRLYGNGGGQLPYLNSIPRKDDLVENAIMVEDAGTVGVFDSTDYVLFYGQSQHKWSYDPRAGCAVPFKHHVHEFADTTYYFLTVDLGAGKRIAKQVNLNAAANQESLTFDDYAFHESDAINLETTGALWLGEKLDAFSNTFKYSPPNLTNIDPLSSVVVRAQMVSSDPNGGEFNLALGNNSYTIKTSPFFNGGDDPPIGGMGSGCFTYNPLSNIALTITKTSASYNGWIDYVEILARRKLAMVGSQLTFRDSKTAGAGNVTHFALSTITDDVTVWDITDPTNVFYQETQKESGKLNFTIQTDSLHQFIAFTGSSYLTPKNAGEIPNQNIHAIAKKDLIIVTHPLFWNQATALAKMHNERDGLSVAVVTNEQVYNEFSSGAKDASAIRDFMRMLYNRATTPAELPKYLMLVGDGSYDNKNRLANNTAFIPAYQSPRSLDPSNSFVSDDFFVQLDDDEGLFDSDGLTKDLPDLAVGRLPFKTQSEAQAVLDKIMRYVETPGIIDVNASSCSTSGSCTSFGDWRNSVCLISDDGEGSGFVTDCESVSTIINNATHQYTLDKIYIDAFPRISTPGGSRFPDAVDAINKRIEKGALFLAYVGHGGEAGLAHERIVSINQINNWKNTCSQPFWITATCEFGRWDNPDVTTGGESVLLNPVGGGIGLFTTVRLIYIYANSQVIEAFFENAFTALNGNTPKRIGDITWATKVDLGPGAEFRGFSLLGDPALALAYPKHKIVTTAINNKTVTAGVIDSVSALSLVTIKGEVHDGNGNKLTGFNGLIYPTLYDKASNITTLSNDPTSPPITFQLQKNILYKGKVSVTNGDFNFSFVVPKDISFQQGRAKLSYYGYNGSEDAGGVYDNLLISGTNPNPSTDKQGPDVKLFLNDEKFVMGSITDETPKIYAVVSDSNGVNSGNGIGHDLVAIIDGKTEAPVILNDYYETEVNNYKKGYIRYPLSKMEPGKHTINMKVWDVYNNSSSSYTEFIVTSNAKLALDHVLNYPNPFTTSTSFYFEHNKPCDRLNVQLQIFTVSGKLVKSMNMITQCDGYKSAPINWDGLDDYGDHIAKGVYIYRLKVTTPKGEAAEKFEKLVVIK